MKKLILLFTLSLSLIVLSFEGQAQCSSSKSHAVKTSYSGNHMDIVDIAISDENFSTLVKAVVTADLVGTLKSDGPFTVFAPTNKAFGKLPSGTIETLLKPESKKALIGILTYHVLSGKYEALDIVNAIKLGGGTATLGTVAGGKLMAMMDGHDVVLRDENGGISKIAATDISASNGVIHVIESVVLPK